MINIQLLTTIAEFLFSAASNISSLSVWIYSTFKPILGFLSIFINFSTIKVVSYFGLCLGGIVFSDKYLRDSKLQDMNVSHGCQRAPIQVFLKMKEENGRDYQHQKEIIEDCHNKLAKFFLIKINILTTFYFCNKLVGLTKLTESVFNFEGFLTGIFIVTAGAWISRGKETRDLRHGSEGKYTDDPSKSFKIFFYYFIVCWTSSKIVSVLADYILLRIYKKIIN